MCTVYFQNIDGCAGDSLTNVALQVSQDLKTIVTKILTLDGPM